MAPSQGDHCRALSDSCRKLLSACRTGALGGGGSTAQRQRGRDPGCDGGGGGDDSRCACEGTDRGDGEGSEGGVCCDSSEGGVCAAMAASAAVVTGVGVLAAEAALTDYAGEDECREEVASLGLLAIGEEACPGLEPRPSLMLHLRNTIV